MYVAILLNAHGKLGQNTQTSQKPWLNCLNW
jgi:hypothetical protein